MKHIIVSIHSSSKKIYATANKNLIVTGGSDCHGDGSPMVGDDTIDYEVIEELRRIEN